jgi:hypothetical protein
MKRLPALIICILFVGYASANSDIGKMEPAIIEVGKLYPTPADTAPPMIDETHTEPGEKCKYPGNIELAIALAGDQNLAYWCHPMVSLHDVVTSWHSKFATLTRTDYDGYTTFEWNQIRTALANLVQVTSTADKTPYWKFLATGIDGQIWTSGLESNLRVLRSQNIEIPMLGRDATTRAAIRLLIANKTLLGKYAPPTTPNGGIGNLTLKQLYHTPADPNLFSDEQVRFVDNTIEIGLLRTTQIINLGCLETHEIDPEEAKKLLDPDVLREWVQSEEEMNVVEIFRAAGNPYCCKVATRICQVAGSGSCNSCGTYCCLAGTTWCP